MMASRRPSSQTLSSTSSLTSTVSPRATKTTISARLARVVWNRRICGLERSLDVAQRQAGDEDGEEARAAQDGREAVDDACGGKRSHRIETLARQLDPAHEEQERSRAGDADGEPDAHLHDEVR